MDSIMLLYGQYYVIVLTVLCYCIDSIMLLYCQYYVSYIWTVLCYCRDLVHIEANCLTPTKMALTMLDYLFDREVQATSNISGHGMHKKNQLNPLFVYGIRCKWDNTLIFFLFNLINHIGDVYITIIKEPHHIYCIYLIYSWYIYIAQCLVASASLSTAAELSLNPGVDKFDECN